MSNSRPSSARRSLGPVVLVIALLCLAGVAFVRFTDQGAALWDSLPRRQGAAPAQKAAAELARRGVLVIFDPSDHSAANADFVCFTGQPVPDDALKLLPALDRLQSLSLMQTKLGDEQLRLFADMPGLRSLSLVGTRITDRGLAHLQGLRGLEGLYLSATAVTDAGLPALAPLEPLAILDLSRTRVTDAGLASLRPMKGIQHLLLVHTAISDAGLAQLESPELLPNLRRLSLTESKVTPAAIARLKQRRPGMNVDF